MRNILRILAVLVVVGLLAVGGFLLLLQFVGGDGQASQPLQASALNNVDENAGTIFTITPGDSTARFSLAETLSGSDITVVGETPDVTGEIFVNFENPAESTVGEIVVNVRTLRTDNHNRDRAIRGFILESEQDAYEFVRFNPTSIEGMPETVTIGEPIAFQIIGDLTIKDSTQPVTFEATVTPESEERITGTASTTIVYEEFGVTIPFLPPSVSFVGDDAVLEINFVAVPGSASASTEA